MPSSITRAAWMLVALACGGLFVTTFPGRDAMAVADIGSQKGPCDSHVQTQPQVAYDATAGYVISGWETYTTSEACVGDTVQIIVQDNQGNQSVARGTLSATPMILVSSLPITAEDASGILVLVTQ